MLAARLLGCLAIAAGALQASALAAATTPEATHCIQAAPPRTPRYGFAVRAHASADGASHHMSLAPAPAGAAGASRGPGNASVVASFSDAAVQPSGFGQLRVWAGAGAPPSEQYYAAGYAEGFLTAGRTADQLANLRGWLARRTNHSGALADWLVQQDMWARREAPKRAAAGGDEGAFWAGVVNLSEQLDGLVDGYNAAAQAAGGAGGLPPLSRAQALLINAIGDLLDLIPAINLRLSGAPGIDPTDAMTDPAAAAAMAPGVLRAALADRGHCSVLIRLLGDLSDIVMGHVTWFSLSFMNRIYKHYDLSGSERASFSSYPGTLSSLDDFYVLPAPRQRMVMLQTTNSILRKDLFSLIDQRSLLAWQRVRLANTLATSGEEWTRIVARENSGTYNNQYMVLDLKKFTPRKAVDQGLLWVAEQMPGRVVSEDVTRMLELGHWASYNVPFFREVYDASGYPQIAALARRSPAHADAVEGASYQLAARAQIFRRDAGSVQGLEDLKTLLRSNGFKAGDPYARGRPGNAVCARNDLDPDRPRATGCTDGKVTNYAAALRGAAWAVNGPTTSQGLPAFKWRAGLPFDAPHRGQPDVFEFQWQAMEP